VRALEVLSGPAALRVPPDAMLGVILRAGCHLLLTQPNGAGAIRAPDVGRRDDIDDVRDTNRFPAPLPHTVDFVQRAPFALSHQVAWHQIFLKDDSRSDSASFGTAAGVQASPRCDGSHRGRFDAARWLATVQV